jgi:hypothetical protein
VGVDQRMIAPSSLPAVRIQRLFDREFWLMSAPSCKTAPLSSNFYDQLENQVGTLFGRGRLTV